MRERKEILGEIYLSNLNAEGKASRKQGAILEVLLDIRDLLGKDLPHMLADIKDSIQVAGMRR